VNTFISLPPSVDSLTCGSLWRLLWCSEVPCCWQTSWYPHQSL